MGLFKKRYKQTFSKGLARSMTGAFGSGQAFKSTIKNVPGAPDLKRLRKKKIRPVKDYTPEAAYEPAISIFRKY